ncbi:ornithine aminomutase subunit alpha [Peloplasma aerotolerans]|jgi:D-ornithine 4,5-aminomutase subunit alpha|uniref:Ornithine aminomutase subunit alpha n=1 Tax=Peloplasma aerotolerans TaxID=3044389 RepID=A0AAW6UE36_9MOLU|nr:ornithine aminomutase subunit alpha [Mariniplasma sp. M4Ah]MDI6453706.1 ornithine aminomutase subunit alpha [Mariniplasma sp. M4Ah]
MKPRNDDFQERRKHLDHLDDHELKEYFYKLTNQMIDPLLELAYEYTSPAIERSVLMRMGFSSLEAKAITDKLMEYQLLEHGAGHVVYVYSKNNKLSIRESGLALTEGKNVEKMMEVFK